jgi:hypothetical protein
MMGVIGLVCVGCPRHESRFVRNEPVLEWPVIKILPGLKTQVNAETERNRIPWGHAEEKSDVTLSAQLSDEALMASTIRGEMCYTLYKFTFSVVKVNEGEWGVGPLTFFAETTFPVPGSDIRIKGMRLFRKDEVLTFKLRKGVEGYLVIAIDSRAGIAADPRAW